MSMTKSITAYHFSLAAPAGSEAEETAFANVDGVGGGRAMVTGLTTREEAGTTAFANAGDV